MSATIVGAPAWLWIACTLAAAALQTARNAMQRSLTGQLGTVGATHVRFLFGLPFALLLLAAVALVTDLSTLRASPGFFAWVLLGSGTQILGTALMLAAMRERSFVVGIAYAKTEPVQVALFALVFLGEAPGAQGLAAILLATVGVLMMSIPPRAAAAATASTASAWGAILPRAALFGIVSGGMFALSAVGFRAAILALGDGAWYGRATVTLAVSLALQAAALTLWLAWRDRAALVGIARLWRPSLLAGAAGALASQMWFLAFSLQTAAAVRTLGLVEILFAQAVSHRLFAHGSTRRELAGIAVMVAALAWLMIAGGRPPT